MYGILGILRMSKSALVFIGNLGKSQFNIIHEIRPAWYPAWYIEQPGQTT